MAIPWAFQYKRQFNWLRDTRAYLYRLIALARKKVILEAGCSVALITEEITERSGALVVGIDSDFAALNEAKQRTGELNLVCGNIYAPPFKEHSFDAIIFQFLMLWLSEPIRALQEMGEILSAGGSITAMGEPDYGGRIDFPAEIDYSEAIAERLIREGADPFIGRKLEYLFRTARLCNIQWGLSSVPFGLERAKEQFREEWQFLETLLGKQSTAQFRALKAHEQASIEKGKRSYFIPVFYCTGEKGKRC